MGEHGDGRASDEADRARLLTFGCVPRLRAQLAAGATGEAIGTSDSAA